MSDPDSSRQLTRELGLLGAVMMGLGSIVGTGVFVSLGVAACGGLAFFVTPWIWITRLSPPPRASRGTALPGGGETERRARSIRGDPRRHWFLSPLFK